MEGQGGALRAERDASRVEMERLRGELEQARERVQRLQEALDEVLDGRELETISEQLEQARSSVDEARSERDAMAHSVPVLALCSAKSALPLSGEKCPFKGRLSEAARHYGAAPHDPFTTAQHRTIHKRSIITTGSIDCSAKRRFIQQQGMSPAVAFFSSPAVASLQSGKATAGEGGGRGDWNFIRH